MTKPPQLSANKIPKNLTLMIEVRCSPLLQNTLAQVPTGVVIFPVRLESALSMREDQ